jgi:hypothetical protein
MNKNKKNKKNNPRLKPVQKILNEVKQNEPSNNHSSFFHYVCPSVGTIFCTIGAIFNPFTKYSLAIVFLDIGITFYSISLIPAVKKKFSKIIFYISVFVFLFILDNLFYIYKSPDENHKVESASNKEIQVKKDTVERINTITKYIEQSPAIQNNDNSELLK